MEIPLIYYFIIGVGGLLLVQTTALFLLKREVHKIAKKVERYIAYILEDEKETGVVERIPERPVKPSMDERQKEQILQEVLAGFFS